MSSLPKEIGQGPGRATYPRSDSLALLFGGMQREVGNYEFPLFHELLTQNWLGGVLQVTFRDSLKKNSESL